jgi:hypothetical protein
MSEKLQPFSMTPQQITAVLVKFGKLLESFALRLSSEEETLSRLVTDAAASIKELAQDVGEGDQDIAAEIVTSTARLVAAIRGLVNETPSRATLH